MMRRAAIVTLIVIAGILGYGYWHSATHASFYVEVKFKNADGREPKTLPKTEVLFLDSAGHMLASGIRDEQYDYVHLIHPEAGDCHQLEKSAPFSKDAAEAWQKCSERMSTWIPKWAGEVRQVQIKTPGCTTKKMPITVSRYNSDWYLWWVPLPHVGGNPSAFYSLSIPVHESDCKN